MQALTGCASLKDYLRHFETTNLLDKYPGRHPSGKGDIFIAAEARAAALALRPSLHGREVVLVGHHVAKAFGLDDVGIFRWTLFHWAPTQGARFAVVPHPSPVNRFWNDPKNWDAARRFFDEAIRRDQPVAA